MIAENKICLSCNRMIRGRSDKKFCNDYCRNIHHNHLKGDDNNYIRNVNNSLLRNRRIMEGILQPAKQISKIPKQLLQNTGFSFFYFTHQHINKKGNCYLFCYEYGYRVVDEQIIVIKRK